MLNTANPPLGASTLVGDERSAVMLRVDELLEIVYRKRDLQREESLLGGLVLNLLKLPPHNAVHGEIYAELCVRWPEWGEILDTDTSEIAAVLAPAGEGGRRATQLKELIQIVAAECSSRGFSGEITLSWLHKLDDDAAQSFLCTLPGIGPDTARCLIQRELGRESFAVDVNMRRIFHRLGLVIDPDHDACGDLYEQILPRRLRHRLRMNLTHHGREVCRSDTPDCGRCPLISFCEMGRRSRWIGDSRPVAVELFAGGGGMGAGFAKAGYRIALAVEWDKNAAQTYRANHPGTVVLEADVRETTGETIRQMVPSADKPEVIVAGPPCQGYSAAGKREATDEKNSLFREVARLASEMQPRFLVMENVPGMRKVGGVGFTQAVVGQFEKSGYDVREHALRACDFGVPQLRHRLIFMSQRKDLGIAPDAPEPTHCAGHYCDDGCGEEPGSRCRRRPTPTVLDALKGLPDFGPGEEAEYRVLDGFVLLNGSTMRHSSPVIEKIRAITPGTGPISYRRLHKDIARTIVAGHRALPVHPVLNRTISVREAARIQGFEDDHVFCGPRSNQPLQVANAVPPPVALAIALHLQSTVRGETLSKRALSKHPRSEGQMHIPIAVDEMSVLV